MLKSLFIKNFILIEEVSLDFAKGFNVLCGETGAGKSIIIKALDCVLGAKASKDVILDKSRPSLIEAVFEINNEEIIISREISSSSKYRLNGILTSLDEIKEKRDLFVDIHSQHQTYTYLQSKNHILLLDNYISKVAPEFKEISSVYNETYIEFKKIEKKLNEVRKNFQDNEKEIDFLTFQLKELDDAQILENEEEEIKSQIDILANVQELQEGTYSSFQALYGDGENIIEALSKVKYKISTCASMDKNLSEIEELFLDSFENLKECANMLRNYSSGLDLDPQKLDELNERLSLIQKLKRKYGQDLDFERNEIAKKLENLTSDDNNLEILEKNYSTTLASIELLAKKISEYRIEYAKKLSILIEEKLKSLELKEAIFEIAVKNIEKNELGQDNVEFLITTNKSKNLSPLAKIASGGEISRVMLALKTIFADIDKTPCVVFDEIDTGISGITSNAVANSILELAKSTQIICITHQPIICAKANNFIWVSKAQEDKTNVKIEILNEEQKLSALAQMASGEVSQQTLDFAKTLLK